MPHVNHQRGETALFVFRREHGKLTHKTYHKDKRGSYKRYKRDINQMHRREYMISLRLVLWGLKEDPYPIGRKLKDIWWTVC